MDEHDEASQVPEQADSITSDNSTLDSGNKKWEVKYDVDVGQRRALMPKDPDIKHIEDTGYIAIQIGKKKGVYKTYSEGETKGTQIKVGDKVFESEQVGEVQVQAATASQFLKHAVFHTTDGLIYFALLVVGVVGFGIQLCFFMGTKFPQHAIEVSTEFAFSALTLSIFLKVGGFVLLFVQAIRKL